MSTTIEHDGFSITSNTETEAAMRAVMGPEGTGTPDATTEPVSPEPADAGTTSDDGPDDSGGTPVATTAPDRRANPRNNTQARISAAIAKQHEAERKAADLETRLAALEQARPAAAEPKEPAKAPSLAVSGKPSWKTFEAEIGQKFESWADAQDAYVDARDDWRDSQQRAAIAHEAKRTAGDEHVARVTAFKATHADYDTVVQAVADITIGPVLETAILALPNSADVVYWLANHRDDFAQLAAETHALDVTAAPIVQRLLDARVGAGARSGAAPGAELSKARPPVRPVGVSSVIVPDEPDDSESFDAYFKRQNSIDRKKGKL